VAIALAIGVAPGSSQVRGPITQADSGKAFSIPRGGEMVLRLSNRWVWSEPRSRSSAVDLLRVDYFVDPGFREWTIAARRRGRATITAMGHRGGLPGRRFRVTIIVTR
jgi:hypothetical protein